MCRFIAFFSVLFFSAVLTACHSEQLGNVELEPSSIYRVVADDLSLELQYGGDGQAADVETWSAIVALLPPETLRAEVAEYHVFSDGEDELLAYVSQLESNPEKWLFAVDSVDSLEKDSRGFVTTVAHEFAHILALGKDQVTPAVERADCAQDYWVEEGCPLNSAQILRYFDRFWKGRLYAEHQQTVADKEGDEQADAVADFYERHLQEFVNEYAATDPIEDFAETFSYFVFLDPAVSEPSASPVQVREQKLHFFFGVPAFVAVRDYIRAQTNIRRDSIDD